MSALRMALGELRRLDRRPPAQGRRPRPRPDPAALRRALPLREPRPLRESEARPRCARRPGHRRDHGAGHAPGRRRPGREGPAPRRGPSTGSAPARPRPWTASAPAGTTSPSASRPLLRGAGLLRPLRAPSRGSDAHDQRREQLPGAHDRRPGHPAGPGLARPSGRRTGRDDVPQWFRHDPLPADRRRLRRRPARLGRSAGQDGGGRPGVRGRPARGGPAATARGLPAARGRGRPGGHRGAAALRRRRASRERARHAPDGDRGAARTDAPARLRRPAGGGRRRQDRGWWATRSPEPVRASRVHSAPTAPSSTPS